MAGARLVCLLALAPAIALAQAKIYVCKDAAGRTLSSDRPIAECSTRPMREMDRHGITRREIPALLTAEEKLKKEDDARIRRAEESAAAERRHNDRAILSRFRSEDAVLDSGRRNVAIVQENIKRENQTLAAAEQRQREAEAELGPLREKDQRPAHLRQRLEEADRAVGGSRRRLDDYEAEILLIHTRTEATLKRYRELRRERAGQQDDAPAAAAGVR
ncbi:MAG: DUF4124 domain-containing protein [Noviherbaspirillum sp.]